MSNASRRRPSLEVLEDRRLPASTGLTPPLPIASLIHGGTPTPKAVAPHVNTPGAPGHSVALTPQAPVTASRWLPLVDGSLSHTLNKPAPAAPLVRPLMIPAPSDPTLTPVDTSSSPVVAPPSYTNTDTSFDYDDFLVFLDPFSDPCWD